MSTIPVCTEHVDSHFESRRAHDRRVPQWRLDEVTRARREAERRAETLQERVEFLEAAIDEIQRRIKEHGIV